MPKSLLIVVGAIVIVFAGMYAFTQGRGNNQDEFNQEGNNPGQILRGDRLDSREPANISQVQEAIQQTEIAVDRAHWDEATHTVHQIRQRWVSYKPGMRAGAGVRMWPPTDVNRFESALAQAEGAIARRDADRAKDALRVLHELAETNDDTREGPAINEQIGR